MELIFIANGFFREKNLLISGDNYGRDLPSVQNLQKKQQHFESELEGHEAKVQQLLSLGHGLEVTVATAVGEIKERCDRMQKLWKELSNASDKRYSHQYSLSCPFFATTWLSISLFGIGERNWKSRCCISSFLWALMKLRDG